jgi:hypothetical protein
LKFGHRLQSLLRGPWQHDFCFFYFELIHGYGHVVPLDPEKAARTAQQLSYYGNILKIGTYADVTIFLWSKMTI